MRAEDGADLGETTKRALAATSLPSHYYWSEEIYKRELDKVFFENWICVGRLDEIPQIGDFCTITIGPESIIVVRDSATTARAHLNVCRHRGCQLVSGKGQVNSFKCPYHGWQYALSGELRGAPEMQSTIGFDKKSYSLFQAKVELWRGFIFINFAANPPPFRNNILGIEEWVQGFDVDNLVTTHTWEYEIECNWKLMNENSIEVYHLPFIHAKTLGQTNPLRGWRLDAERKEPWELLWGDFPMRSFGEEGAPKLPLIEGIGEREKSGIGMVVIYPMLWILPTVDSLYYSLIFPTGPETMWLKNHMCVPKKTAEGFKTDADLRAKAEEYSEYIREFQLEDNVIMAQHQRGLRSRRTPAFRYSKHEVLVFKFHEWLRERAYAGMESDKGAQPART